MDGAWLEEVLEVIEKYVCIHDRHTTPKKQDRLGAVFYAAG